MAIHIRRRELLAALGSAATWPVVARAQQLDRIRRIGMLTGCQRIARKDYPCSLRFKSGDASGLNPEEVTGIERQDRRRTQS